MVLELIKQAIGRNKLGSTRFLLVNAVLVLGIIAGIIFLWLNMKILAQVSLVIALVALFLNRPQEVFFRRYGVLPSGVDLEEHNTLVGNTINEP